MRFSVRGFCCALFIFEGCEIIMSHGIVDYLNHLPLTCVEAIFEEYSRKENFEQFGYLLPTIKDVLEKRKSEENNED